MQHRTNSRIDENRFKLIHLIEKFLGTGLKRRERREAHAKIQESELFTTTSKDRRWRRPLNFYSWKFSALSGRQLNMILWRDGIKVILPLRTQNKEQRRKIYDPGPQSSTQKVKVILQKDNQTLRICTAYWPSKRPRSDMLRK